MTLSRPERAPDHVISDLSVKLAADVSSAIWRTIALVDHPLDMGVIATLGASTALGSALGFFERGILPNETDKEKLLDAFWARIRPAVLASMTKRS